MVMNDLMERKAAAYSYGQFTIEQWAGGWKAVATISCNEHQCFFGSTETDVRRAVGEAYDRGIVPFCAVPEAEWQEDARVSNAQFAAAALRAHSLPSADEAGR